MSKFPFVPDAGVVGMLNAIKDVVITPDRRENDVQDFKNGTFSFTSMLMSDGSKFRSDDSTSLRNQTLDTLSNASSVSGASVDIDGLILDQEQSEATVEHRESVAKSAEDQPDEETSFSRELQKNQVAKSFQTGRK